MYRKVMGYTVSHIGESWQLATDANGRFTTPMLPAGEVGVAFQVAGRRNALVKKTVPPGAGEEELPPVKLENDVPIHGTVRAEDGHPLAGATIWTFAGVPSITTDDQGGFVLHGLGPKPSLQLIVQKSGYVMHNAVHREITALQVTLRRVAWITGRAEDADTGEPVRVSKAILCTYERRPNGEIVRRG